ncbi:MAG: hypothetical protein CME61_03600 [Halobacteriovoraceae bacterium]|nr:hypothetical protein [Halobacteriovoraceae bacterium]
MRIIVLFTLFTIHQSFGFSLYTEAELSTNWFGRSKKIVDLRQRNSTYFENLSVDGQLSLEKWLERNTQLEESGYFSTRRLDNKSVKNLVGKIIRKVGDVRIERDSALTKGSNGSFLYKGDTIETMETGATWIVLINGALVRVSPNSSISISEYIFNEKKMTFFLRLNFGELLGKLKSKNDYTIADKKFSDLAFEPVLSKEELSRFYKTKGENFYGPGKFDLSELNQLVSRTAADNKVSVDQLENVIYFITNNGLFETRDGHYHLINIQERTLVNFSSSKNNGKFSLAKFNPNQDTLENGKWYLFNDEGGEMTDLMRENEVPAKTILSELSPIYYLRDKFLLGYGFLFSIMDYYPTIKLSNSFWGDKFSQRLDYLISFFRRSEASFKIVRRSKKKLVDFKFDQSLYYENFHRLTLRLGLLDKLKVLDLSNVDKKIPTISGQFKKFQEIMRLNINKTLIKLKNESIDKEYISRK